MYNPYSLRLFFFSINILILIYFISNDSTFLSYVLEISVVSSFVTLGIQFGLGNQLKTFRKENLSLSFFTYSLFISFLLLIFIVVYLLFFTDYDINFIIPVILLSFTNFVLTIIAHIFRINEKYIYFVLYSSISSPLFIMLCVLTESIIFSCFLCLFCILVSPLFIYKICKNVDSIKTSVDFSRRSNSSILQLVLSFFSINLINSSITYFPSIKEDTLLICIRLLQTLTSIQSFIDIKVWNYIGKNNNQFIVFLILIPFYLVLSFLLVFYFIFPFDIFDIVFVFIFYFLIGLNFLNVSVFFTNDQFVKCLYFFSFLLFFSIGLNNIYIYLLLLFLIRAFQLYLVRK